MERRVYVGAVGAIFLGFAGCLTNDESSAPDGPKGNDDETSNGGDERNSGDEGATDFDPAVDVRTKLGRADPVSIEAEPEREYEYLEDDDAVHIEYDTGETSDIPFDEWGTLRALEAGAEYVRNIVGENDWKGVYVSQRLTESRYIDANSNESEFDRDFDVSISVDLVTTYARDGTKIREPSVEFDVVSNAIPRKIEVTMLFPERDYTAVFPIICHRSWGKED